MPTRGPQCRTESRNLAERLAPRLTPTQRCDRSMPAAPAEDDRLFSGRMIFSGGSTALAFNGFDHGSCAQTPKPAGGERV